MTNDNLLNALAKVRPGDTVTVEVQSQGHTATLTGEVWVDGDYLRVGSVLIRHLRSGNFSVTVTALLDHHPYRWLPTEDGYAVRVYPSGARSIYFVRDGKVSRRLLADGTLDYSDDPATLNGTWEPLNVTER